MIATTPQMYKSELSNLYPKPKRTGAAQNARAIMMGPIHLVLFKLFMMSEELWVMMWDIDSLCPDVLDHFFSHLGRELKFTFIFRE